MYLYIYIYYRFEFTYTHTYLIFFASWMDCFLQLSHHVKTYAISIIFSKVGAIKEPIHHVSWHETYNVRPLSCELVSNGLLISLALVMTSKNPS